MHFPQSIINLAKKKKISIEKQVEKETFKVKLEIGSKSKLKTFLLSSGNGNILCCSDSVIDSNSNDQSDGNISAEMKRILTRIVTLFYHNPIPTLNPNTAVRLGGAYFGTGTNTTVGTTAVTTAINTTTTNSTATTTINTTARDTTRDSTAETTARDSTARDSAIPHHRNRHHHHHHRTGKSSAIPTCFAFHPSLDLVCVGDSFGKITIFYYSTADSPLSKGVDVERGAVLHWHAADVGDIDFCPDDPAYLASGGLEGTLVLWDIETMQKKFLPRLGGAITTISCSSFNIALLLDTHALLTIDHSLTIVSRTYLGLAPTKNRNVFISDPATGYIITSGPQGCLQILHCNELDQKGPITVAMIDADPYTNRIVFENRLVQNRASISKAAVSGGEWLACSASTTSNGTHVETLSFWKWDAQASTFVMHTSIPECHSQPVTSIFFHPKKSTTCLTASKDNTLKVWTYTAVKSWHCTALINLPTSLKSAEAFPHISWAPDASCVAVGSGSELSIWDLETGTCHGTHTFPGSICSVVLVDVRALVSTTTHLYTLDLVRGTVVWGICMRVRWMERDEDVVYVGTRTSVVVFGPEMVPLKSWSVDGCKGMAVGMSGDGMFVLDRNGQVEVVSGANGRGLERRGRVFQGAGGEEGGFLGRVYGVSEGVQRDVEVGKAKFVCGLGEVLEASIEVASHIILPPSKILRAVVSHGLGLRKRAPVEASVDVDVDVDVDAETTQPAHVDVDVDMNGEVVIEDYAFLSLLFSRSLGLANKEIVSR